MVGFIYKTTNLINKKKYIGRKIYTGDWQNYLGSSKLLQADIEQYGKDSFIREIIEECSTYEELQERELYWQLHYKVKESEDFYNITYATEGFDTSGSRFSYSKAELTKIWPQERRKKSSNNWKDPGKNPNNLKHVREARSKRMKKNNIFKDPEFIKKNVEKKSRPFLLEYNNNVFMFKTQKAAIEVFGNAAISAIKRGIKVNNPYKGLSFKGYTKSASCS
jgi:hypothetical protein